MVPRPRQERRVSLRQASAPGAFDAPFEGQARGGPRSRVRRSLNVAGSDLPTPVTAERRPQEKWLAACAEKTGKLCRPDVPHLRPQCAHGAYNASRTYIGGWVGGRTDRNICRCHCSKGAGHGDGIARMIRVGLCAWVCHSTCACACDCSATAMRSGKGARASAAHQLFALNGLLTASAACHRVLSREHSPALRHTGGTRAAPQSSVRTT